MRVDHHTESSYGGARSQRPQSEKFGPSADRQVGRSLSGEEIYFAVAVFCYVHRECGEAVRARHENGAVELWCELCGDSRVHEINEPEFRLDPRYRPIFR